jgi:hypothetical protein
MPQLSGNDPILGLNNIQQVLRTLRKHKLYSNLEKCSFGINRVQYLGYIVDECWPLYVEVSED